MPRRRTIHGQASGAKTINAIRLPLLAVLWSTYCFVHSALISAKATHFIKRVLGTRYAYYRLIFNAFSFIAFVPLLLYSRLPKFQDPAIFLWPGNWRILRYSLIVFLYRTLNDAIQLPSSMTIVPEVCL